MPLPPDITPKKSPPTPRQKLAGLLIVYLTALQQSPGLTEEEWQEAKQMKHELALDLK